MIKFRKIGTFDYNSLPFDEFFAPSEGRLVERSIAYLSRPSVEVCRSPTL